MQQHRGRWKLIAGGLLLPALSCALASVHTGPETTLPVRQETMAQAQAISSNVRASEVRSQLHQVTLHITGMS